MNSQCPPKWKPEDWSAHLVRCQFAELMDLGHSSILRPEYLVHKFRKIVQQRERKRMSIYFYVLVGVGLLTFFVATIDMWIAWFCGE